jgi:hypothetical protein
MGANFSRVKTWVSTEDVTYSDLNAEFDNILNNLTAANVDDFSANVAQMQSTADPGEVATESLPTSVAGEIQRIRHILKEITGKTYWYQSPISSLAGLSNAIGSGLTDNRLVSGRVRTTSAQPLFLVPNGAARTVKLDGTPTSFVYYVNGTEYTISSDVTLTNLTAAPAANNTCLINDAVAADQYWTKYQGEDGTEIAVDAMGSEISALVGKFAAFKLNNGAADEYFIAYVKSTTALSKARRGYFFDSTDAAIPRVAYADNDTITLMKLTWVFAKTDGTLTATYTNPTWSDDEPSSPAIGDYWYDTSANTWMKYDVGSWSSAGANLVGVCLQDTTNTVAARSFDFFKSFDALNTIEVIAESNTQVKMLQPGGQLSVYGTTYKGEYGLQTWDMTLDLESGVTEAASTYYYFYITETGDKVISDKKPQDRGDLLGKYHPSHSWRCVGHAFNNASSNLEQVESYYRAKEANTVRSVAATDSLLLRDRVVLLSGASFTEYLPPAALTRGNVFRFIHNGTSFSQVYTLDGFGAETIGGSATYPLYSNGETLSIISDGSNYLVLDHKSDTPWAAYTPASGTFNGFGTPASINGYRRRVGDSLHVRLKFTAGTVTPVEARAPFIETGETSTSSSSIATIELCGYWANGSVTTAQSMHVLIEPSVGYFTFGLQNGAGNGLAKRNGSTLVNNSEIISLFATIPMANWKA